MLIASLKGHINIGLIHEADFCAPMPNLTNTTSLISRAFTWEADRSRKKSHLIITIVIEP